jgi:hypothetical protein
MPQPPRDEITASDLKEVREYIAEVAVLMYSETPTPAARLAFHLGGLVSVVLRLAAAIERNGELQRSSETILDEVARLRSARRALAEKVRDYVREACANKARDVGSKLVCEDGHDSQGYGAGLAASAIRGFEIDVSHLLEEA